ncbi:MAG: DUF3471 domain-containing protein [Chloroflexi bacterium]|nr:DUF3471 domain-containing protein [Chloroflexota bacterium]
MRDIIQYNVFDRFIDGEQVPWNARFKADAKELEAARSRGKQKTRADRVRGTRPSHRLEDYVGAYAHPGYGTLRVELEGGQLQAVYNGLSFKLRHHHYDTFAMAFERFGLTFMASFLTDVRGTIHQISLPLEPTVASIVFTRAPDAAMTERSFLERFTGTYEIMGNVLSVEFKGEVLQVSMPGMPEYELVPHEGTEFSFKGLSAASIEFKQDDSGTVTEALITQMGSVFSARKR